MSSPNSGLNEASKGARKILLVEDDEHCRQFAAAVLERGGFEVLQAGDSGEAFEIWSEERDSIEILLSDIVLPGLKGPDIARRLVSEKPNLKILFVSAFADEEFLRTAQVPDASKFLGKPFPPSALLELIRQL